MEEPTFSKKELQLVKTKLVLKEEDISNLSSETIKRLLDFLDWSIEKEKRVIINLCREITKRGDVEMITGDNRFN